MADRSPAVWLDILEKRLDARWRELKVYDAYYEGDHVLNFATRQWRETFGANFAQLVDNWCPIIVDSAAERLKVQGFRFGSTQDADSEAWAIWNANNLGAGADMVHTEAIKLSESYWLVEPRGKGEVPRITWEHPSQMIVATAPGDPRTRLAALKRWVDTDDGHAYANVFLPDGVYKYRSKGSLVSGGVTGGRINWASHEGSGPNLLGVVPAIPVPNNPSMLTGGRSDLAGGVISLQNAVNKLIADMLIGSEYIAYPQRVMMGVTPPIDPETGQPMTSAKLRAAMDRLWMFSGKDAKAYEFSAGQLENFAKAMDTLIKHLTAQTKTPPHYVIGEVVNVSGDALKAAETGLVSKVRKKQEPFGDAHEELMRLSFLAMGDDERAREVNVETIWRDPESRSQAELADALTKLKSINVPDEVLWEKYGFTPQEIDRMVEINETRALLGIDGQEDEVSDATPAAVGADN